MRTTLLLFILCIGATLHAQQGVFGKWVTVDDETGKPRSIVEVTERNGKAYGRVIKLFREPGENPDPVCKECDEDDDRYMKRVLGMEVLRDMVRNDDVWEDGTVLDPKNGGVYDSKMWLEGDKLKLRGYLLFFFRTQTWVRAQPGQ